MGKLMKASLLTSLKALEQAGIEKPDAIITTTALGCVENSELLLRQIEAEGEVMLKPTLFMQSTHNTVACNIAIRTHCHGYNITYCPDIFGEGHHADPALRDAELLLRSGSCKTVLVGYHDETTPLYRSLIERLKAIPRPAVPPCPRTLDKNITSIAIVLSCSE